MTTMSAPTRPLPSNTTARLLPPAGTPSTLDAHLHRLGPLPLPDLATLLGMVSAIGLGGRGGARFPVARKMEAVAQASTRRRRRPVVVANCSEGDPTAAKDLTLAQRAPHLIIDGALVAARALGADRIVLSTHRGSPAARALREALAERHDGVDAVVVEHPDRYVASEGSAVVHHLVSGDARPLGRLAAVHENGVGGAPTLVHNAETLAVLGLLARFGSDWYAGVGDPAEPGTTIVTISGAVARPGTVELAFGTGIDELFRVAGAPSYGDALVGGLAGGWADIGDLVDLPYTSSALARAGAGRGVGSVVVLPPGGCVLTETARIAQAMAAASAGQCGPCMFGLPAIAADLAALRDGHPDALDRLGRRLPVIDRRGGCGHPDGVVALVSSALRVVTGRDRAHLDQHLRRGPCAAPAPVVPLPGDHR